MNILLLIPQENGYSIEYKSVRGFIMVNEDTNCCSIYEWSSHNHGIGETREALKSIKKKYKVIHVVGIGRYSSDPSWTYWVHMKSCGLVDSGEDDEGRTVF
jgi:hypothetical protein